MNDVASLVLHVPAAGDLMAVIRSVDNLRRELGDQVVIEVVAHGPGLEVLLAESAVAAQVADRLAAGVAFTGCQNTLNGRGLTSADLVPGVAVAGSGLAHAAQRQWQGYAYVRL